MKRIGYLGPLGTYTQQAAEKWRKQYCPQAELVPLSTIPHVVRATATGQVDYGVVPVENSIEGSVSLTLDELFRNKGVHMVGEVVTEIRHFLANASGCIEDINEVYTHSHAMAQCRLFLEEKLAHVPVLQTASTAEAARLVAAGSRGMAAICSENAVKEYRLKVVARDIQDASGNKTRFAIVGTQCLPATGCDKTSLVLALPENRPGGLFKALELFANAQVNLTKIESRPSKKELGEYLFFIDCEGHMEDAHLKQVLHLLEKQAALLVILGSYPVDKGGTGLGHSG